MRLFFSLPVQEKVNFARHLHLTTKSGLTLIDGLNMIAEQTSSRTMRVIVNNLVGDLSKGKLLGQALERYKDVFGPFFTSIVRVGEESGRLSENMVYLASELQKRQETTSKIRAALIYPIIILIATMAISSFLVFFVLPKMIPIIKELKVELPLATKILIFIVEFLSSNGIIVGIGIALFVFFMKTILKTEKIRFVSDWLLLSVPVVSSLNRNFIISNFSRSLGLLLKSGFNVVEALRITGGSLNNLVYKKLINEAAEKVRMGEQVAFSLKKHKKTFPIMFVNLVRVGETTGNLEENLFYLAEHFDSELDSSIKNLTTVLEPVLLLLMGILVGFVAISIILPIYKVSAPKF